MKELRTRKNIRLKGYDYSGAGAYFVTICTKDKHEMLGKVVGAATCRPKVRLSEIGETVNIAINHIGNIYPHITVEHYVIMPNHVHILLRIKESDGRQIAAPTLQTVIGNMKRFVSMQIGYSIWQRSFHDHVIRDDEDYCRIAQYIEENPARWEEDCYYINKRETGEPS